MLDQLRELLLILIGSSLVSNVVLTNIIKSFEHNL